MNPIALGQIIPPELIKQPAAPQHTGAGSFAGMLEDALVRVQEIQSEADGEVRKLVAGEPVNLHRVILAGEKAGLAFELMMGVRRKVVEAYQEVMRMPV